MFPSSDRSPASVRRRLQRLGVAAALAAGASLAAAGIAAGHAVVVRTEPADGAVVAEPPREVVLVFSERVAVDLTAVSIVDSRGRSFAPTALGPGPDGPETLVVSLPPLPDDVYRISWTTVSDDDLHATRGALVLAVGAAAGARSGVDATDPAPGTNPSPAPLAPLEGLVRSVQLLGLALLLGCLVLARLAGGLEPASEPRLRRRLVGWAAVGALGAGLAGLGRLAVAAVDGRTTLGGLVAGSAFGGRAVAEAGVLLAVAFLLLVAHRPIGRQPLARSGTLAVGGLVGLVAILDAANGHLAARDSLVGLALATLHLLAAGLWVGGLLGLALVVGPGLRAGARSREPGGPAARPGRILVRRFSPLAAAAVGLLAFSGSLAAGELVATPDALLTSDYGRILLLKTGLAGLVAGVGLRNAAAVQPVLRMVARAARRVVRGPLGAVARRGGGGRGLATRIRLEAALGVLVVATAGWLVGTAPARGPAFDPLPASAVHPSASGRAADLVVTLSVRPNRPGRNIAAIGVFDTRRPAPAPIVGVSLVRSDPSGTTRVGLPARSLGEGRYEVGGDLFETPGRWLVGVVVERAGLAPASFVADWDVPPAGTPAERSTLVAQVPLGDLARPAAILVGLGYGSAVGLIVLLGRRRTRPTRRADRGACLGGDRDRDRRLRQDRRPLPELG